MSAMPPPPAYSGNQAPPPSYPTQKGEAPAPSYPSQKGGAPPPSYPTQKGGAPPPAYSTPQGGAQNRTTVYWVYWGVLLFGTLLTWIFTVSAVADDAWITVDGVGDGLSFEAECSGYDEEYCNLYNAARAFQILATVVVSLALVMGVAAAFMAAPITGKLGLAAGITLAVHAVFQLIAFGLMADFINSSYFTDGYYLYANAVTPGPTFGVAVTAWILGTAGAIVCLVYRVRATTEQDGPIKALMQGGANAGQPGVPAVGTV